MGYTNCAVRPRRYPACGRHGGRL